MHINTNWAQLVESGGPYLYHATHTKNVPAIKAKGLLPMQPTNWVKAGTGERYGGGQIYAFEHPADAVRWGAKMDWDTHKKMGTGKISVVRLAREGDWKSDSADPLAQAGRRGAWVTRMHHVRPEHVIDAVPVTTDLARRVVKDRGEDSWNNLFEGTLIVAGQRFGGAAQRLKRKFRHAAIARDFEQVPTFDRWVASAYKDPEFENRGGWAQLHKWKADYQREHGDLMRYHVGGETGLIGRKHVPTLQRLKRTYGLDVSLKPATSTVILSPKREATR